MIGIVDPRSRKAWGAGVVVSLLPAVAVCLLLFPVQSALAAGQIVAGTTNVGNNLSQYGTTSYTIDYSYTPTAQVGKNLTITLTLSVNEFGGLVEYITAYEMFVDVYIGSGASQRVLNGSLISAVQAPFLYPGSTWGPNNVTIPLTAANTGVSKGQSANATVGLTLEDTDYFGLPYAGYQTEPLMAAQAGSFVIENGVTTSSGESSQTILPYALLSSGVALMVIAVVLPKGQRQQAAPK